MDYRPDAHAVSDSLGSTWNGIVGRIELRSTTPVWIDEVQVHPSLATQSAVVKVRIGNSTGKAGEGTLSVDGAAMAVEWGTNGGSAELGFSIAGAKPWDEFSPVLQRHTLLLTGGEADDSRELVFGVRDFKTEGREFVINGRKTNLRGTHHGGDFPLTGYPPCDVEYWLKVWRTCKAWGLNHVRFHSFCPPEAAFTAADEVGLYLQVEPGMWNVISPGTPMEAMLYTESDRMIRAYGNHPSFVLMSASNEAKGHWKQSLPKWVAHYREADPRRLYTPDTGWSLIDDPQPVADQVDYLAVHRIGQRLMRGDSGWFGRDYSSSYAGVDVPNIVHENGQWCAYPDYDVIRKFTGYMRPGNYEIFRDSLAAHGMADRDKDFAWASGRFQLACYKEEVEANLRTSGLGGFQLLDLHDYVGQGTALVGLLDPFWEEKSYVAAEEWRQFCNTTVPLARLLKRVFTTTDSFEVPVEVAHYGLTPIEGVVASWRVIDEAGAVAAQGSWPAQDIPIGKGTELGQVSVDLPALAAPQGYRLVVELAQPGGNETRTTFRNEWNFWLYPADVDSAVPEEVLLTRSWREAASRLAAGGKVLFQPRKADLDWSSPPLARLPIFWNRLMSPGWSRMLGVWCDTNHPALAGFPTDANCDWQWTSILHDVRAMNLDKLPGQLQPIVQAIDDWNRNWKLGVVFECTVGSGELMVCTVNLEEDLDRRPVARQLRRSLLDYMAGPDFQPDVDVPAAVLGDVLFNSRIMSKLEASAQADGANPEAVIDGDPNTAWRVGAPARRVSAVPHPHTITLSFPQPVTMQGLVIMTRQNDRNRQGDVREYRLEASDDGEDWREVSTGELASTLSPQTLTFSKPLTVTKLRFTALSGFGGDPSAALAELAVLYAGPTINPNLDGTLEYKRSRSTSTDVDEGN